MKVVIILFDEDKKNILCGGIGSDRFIEVESNHSAVNYTEVEESLKSVGLTALRVNYKLLGYNTTVWVCEPDAESAEVIAEYIITGIVYNTDALQQGYVFVPIDDFIKNAKSDGNYRRLDYLYQAFKRMNIE